MTVMLLQRFAAPQPMYVIKNIKHTCDYEADTGLKTTPIILSHENKDKQYQIQEQKKINDTVVTNIDSHYCNNIKKQNNSINSNNNNNAIVNNNNNNNINITVNCSEKEKINNVTNSCKDDKFQCTNSYYLGKTTTNNTSNNYNNNNNNNNNNININNNEAVEEEEEELLVRDKFSRRQETITSNTTVITTGTAGTSATSASQGRFFGQGVAMRYYRLWIYACNIVLLGSALGFAAAVLRTFVFSGDPRRFLVPGVPHAFDPTALYAYLALATQLGLVQLLGCIAARRLSARLLNIYWLLLLALLFGDVIIGVAWVFRYERMRAELRPALKLKLQLDYNKESRFSYHWDRLQRDFSCCGVTGPSDFDSQFLPQTCCPDTSSNDYGISNSGIDIISDGNNNIQTLNANETYLCRQPFANGCEDYLMHWLRKTADLLFVVGFCVVAFAKLCFLGILRYEIREMIQKIRLLREPPPPASSQFIQSFCQGVQATPITTAITSTHGSSAGLGTATPTIAGGDITSNNIMCNYGGSRRTTLPIVVSSSTVTNNPSNFGNNVALLPQQLSQDYGNKHSLLYTTNLQQDTGADSDTNSHCALILEETTPTPTARNYNSTREKSNGNNNYEMHEFNSHYLLSNGASPQTGIKVVGQNRRT